MSSEAGHLLVLSSSAESLLCARYQAGIWAEEVSKAKSCLPRNLQSCKEHALPSFLSHTDGWS